MPAPQLCRSSRSLLLAAALGGCAAPSADWAFASEPDLAEDPAVDAALRRALTEFLTDGTPAASDARPHAFFYESLRRGMRNAQPIVLKAHPIGADRHRVTIAFLEGPAEKLRITRIVELDARPDGDTFQLESPYDRRTASMRRHTIRSVTFRFRGALDTRRAAEFVAKKERLERLLGQEPAALEYDCFASLDALLKAYGLVHDASKCNFLQHDLGFLTDGGKRFVTGTQDPAYLFGYVRGVLALHASDAEAIYAPYLNGVAAYYGGYSLSGDSVEVLARQFREEARRRPNIDFLAEFRKGRASSVQRHFSHYVMCAFLCRAIVARHGEKAALELVECGAEGERFFAGLERLLGVTAANFHETIRRLIAAE